MKLMRQNLGKALVHFAVETKINRAKQLVRQYQITGVPTVIVDGMFKISATTAGGYPQLVGVIDSLTTSK